MTDTVGRIFTVFVVSILWGGCLWLAYESNMGDILSYLSADMLLLCMYIIDKKLNISRSMIFPCIALYYSATALILSDKVENHLDNWLSGIVMLIFGLLFVVSFCFLIYRMYSGSKVGARSEPEGND